MPTQESELKAILEELASGVQSGDLEDADAVSEAFIEAMSEEFPETDSEVLDILDEIGAPYWHRWHAQEERKRQQKERRERSKSKDGKAKRTSAQAKAAKESNKEWLKVTTYRTASGLKALYLMTTNDWQYVISSTGQKLASLREQTELVEATYKQQKRLLKLMEQRGAQTVGDLKASRVRAILDPDRL